MRLIDADKIKEYILTKGFYCDTQADKESTAKEIDELFPTVKAISVEWLKRYELAKGQEVRLQDAINEWEKENGE